ncbi:hypothetical protein DOTSEDRAFT_71604 [Lecanosticta acicola]|uniref:Something about silencing protein 4 domain-containing protein n=1 Tax=Lecanosticta acicola TaxID=111012 RepID=A0AAI9EAZ0_9PEZI|nr:hypothetical protein DOTSEDRAFT_71604 [Lecanosticta acicola]
MPTASRSAMLPLDKGEEELACHTPKHASGGALASRPPQQHKRSHPDGTNNPHADTHHSVRSTTIAADSLANGDDDARPAKRPRLSIRAGSSKSTQAKLDHFLPKPPSKVVRQEPHGHLVQSVNGVQTTLESTEDELLRPSPKPERVSSRRTTRSPQPPPPPQLENGKDAARGGKQEDKRTLRSQDDGPRLKSELAIYFPYYEDIVFDAPREDEEEFLTVDSALWVTDDTLKSAKSDTSSPAKPSKNAAANSRRTSVNGGAAPPPLTPRSSSNLNGSRVLDFESVAKHIPANPEDPLTDEHFLKSHRRAERKEKQLRNIERERAMHEKVQLERILAGLQGHDWLRVLGITGITDGEARKYEQKRDYFIAEVKALVDKFRQWKEQEKKQRLEKEAAAAAREAEEEGGGESTEGSVEPPSSDLNASAARQLQQETVNAVKNSAKASGKGKERAHPTSNSSHPATPTISTAPVRQMLPPAPPSPEVPITSFYSKRHLRDAALGKARHGRNITAFGHPLPDMEEVDFELPDDYVTEDAIRANARERRRRKRESAANSSSKR